MKSTKLSVGVAVLVSSVVACGGGGSTPAQPAPGPATVKPVPIDMHLPPGCGLDSPAFCETFDAPSPGGRGGDIDETIWSFSRWGNLANRWFGRGVSDSIGGYYDERGSFVMGGNSSNIPPTMCGQQFSNVDAPNDVRVCNGQLNEVFNDLGSLVATSMRVRQPFDFTDRTGTIVFDVDAKRNDGWDGHGWWLELWVSADPTPFPYHGAPTVESYTGGEAVGFQILPSGPCFSDVGQNNLGRVVHLKNYVVVSDENLFGTCFKVKDTRLNRFKVRINREQAEFWVTDAESSEEKLVITYELDLGFSFGYVHLQHVHYNASKTPNGAGLRATSVQAYHWDNVGFDGPVYTNPRGYDSVDEFSETQITKCGSCSETYHAGTNFGHYLTNNGEPRSSSVNIENVDLTNARKATLGFNLMATGGQRIKYQFNGLGFHDFTVPASLNSNLLRSFTIDVPLADLVAGSNVLAVEAYQGGPEAIGNIELTVEPQ